jgi:hypothetical protein
VSAGTIPPAEWLSYEQPRALTRRALLAHDLAAYYLSAPAAGPERHQYVSRLLFTVWRLKAASRVLRNRVVEAESDA